jgi:hypothetical protein
MWLRLRIELRIELRWLRRLLERPRLPRPVRPQLRLRLLVKVQVRLGPV